MTEGPQLLLPVVPGPALVAGPVFLCFEYPGKPPHKARHRARIVIPSDLWSWVGGVKMMLAARAKKIFISMYPDPETKASEEAIAQYARVLMRGRPPTVRPVALLVHAFKPVPESWTRRERELALLGAILPTSKPDGDNYLKLAQDALNKIVWHDDSQIADARIIKRYSERPALRIEVREFVEPIAST